MRQCSHVFLLAVLVSVPICSAQPRGKIPADPCANATTQVDINACTQQKYLAADAELNTAYKELMALTDVRLKPKLVAAEQAWIVFRDAQCDFADSAYEGGSIRPAIR